MVKQMTHKRVLALNELALMGELEVIAHWAERYNIPIDGTDDEIRAAVLGSRRDVTLKTARLAAERLRRSQDARKILLARYPATPYSAEDITFSDMETLGAARKLGPSLLRKGLYLYRGHHVMQTSRRRRVGTLRFRQWQIGRMENGEFVPENKHEIFTSRVAALDAIDERRNS